MKGPRDKRMSIDEVVDTLEDGAVTVRERDTMQQERIAIDGISGYFAQRFLGA